jgi:hypothetical protein
MCRRVVYSEDTHEGKRRTTMAKRVTYQRGSLDSTIAAARKVATTEPRYVFATALGFMIDRRPPPFGQQHVVVATDGTATLAERK